MFLPEDQILFFFILLILLTIHAKSLCFPRKKEGADRSLLLAPG
jgi:hypothetical protein